MQEQNLHQAKEGLHIGCDDAGGSRENGAIKPKTTADQTTPGSDQV